MKSLAFMAYLLYLRIVFAAGTYTTIAWQLKAAPCCFGSVFSTVRYVHRLQYQYYGTYIGDVGGIFVRSHMPII